MLYLGAALLVFIGLFGLLVCRNTMRLLIALEIMVKGVTLLLLVIARDTASQGLGQALFITMLLVEVVVAVVVLAFIIHAYRHTGSLDVRKLSSLKG